MKNNQETVELEKLKTHIIVQVIEYLPNSVVSKTIMKRITGNVTLSSFDEGEELPEKLSPYDTFVQIIDGTAEITIDNKLFTLHLGEGMIIPSHALHHFHANKQFKMIATVIKSGYED
jgi:quercetin dioxygenase-like cupin family protein